MIISKIPTPILHAAVKFATYGNRSTITTVRIEATPNKSYTHLSLFRGNAEFSATWPGNSFIGKIPEDGVVVSIYGTPPPTGLATISTTSKSVIFEETGSKIKALHAIAQSKRAAKHKEWEQSMHDYINHFNSTVDHKKMTEKKIWFNYSFLCSIFKGEFQLKTRGNDDESVKLVVARKCFESGAESRGCISATFLDAEVDCNE